MPTVFIKTFGCKVNYTESVDAAEQLGKLGIPATELTGARLPGAGIAPVVIVNSCCVTREAERKALQFVRRMRRDYPEGRVIFTGCAARHDEIRQRFSAAGAEVIEYYPEAIDRLRSSIDVPDTGGGTCAAGHHGAVFTSTRARSFIKIQDGCTCRCSYCIIPDVRPYYTRPPEEILVEAGRRLADGCCELVLTGVNAGHYGRAPLPRADRDRHPAGSLSLPGLIESILAIMPGHARLRLSSIEPEDVDNRLLDLLAHPRMCPHLHLPLQSGCDRVLADMGRAYSAAYYIAVADSFRRVCPGGALTTDILVGYPTETAADFTATLDLCTRVGFERVHGFPFSSRPGTPASELKLLPGNVIHDRNRRLLGHCRAVASERWERFLGTTADVLIEEHRDGAFIGHGAAYQLVNIPVAGMPYPGGTDIAAAADALVGRIKPVRLTAFTGEDFTGELV